MARAPRAALLELRKNHLELVVRHLYLGYSDRHTRADPGGQQRALRVTSTPPAGRGSEG